MRILFVCTGNIFRSLTAEYSLNEHAKKNGLSLRAESAGTMSGHNSVLDVVHDSLMKLGLDVSEHEPRCLTKELIEENDLIISMGLDHQAYIRDEFNHESVLFNELCYGIKKSVLDVGEKIPDWDPDSGTGDEYIREVIGYIHDSIPLLIKNL